MYEFVIKEHGKCNLTPRYSSMVQLRACGLENLEIHSPLHHWANNHQATHYHPSQSTAQDGAECTHPAAPQYVSISILVQPRFQALPSFLLLASSLVPQTPPSHEEKQSGEPSQIYWASVYFCDIVT